MADVGQVLYEMHVENCKQVQSLPASIYGGIPEWHELNESAKQTWRKTAQDFMERMYK